MSDIDNLAKFEWENEIPFPIEKVKKSIHAMIGEPDILGLINYNPKNNKWHLNSIDPIINASFGSYSFGQANSSVSATVKEVDEKTTNLKVTVSARRGGLYGNQPYLQTECDRFNKALSYYLEHEDEVEVWHNEFKPSKKAANNSPKSGCMLIMPIIMAGGFLLWFFA